MPIATQAGSTVTGASIVDESISNADIATNAAIAISKLAPGPWEELADVTLGADTASLATGTFAARNRLKVEVWINGLAGSAVTQFRFNGDSGANYASSHSVNGGAAAVGGTENQGTMDSSSDTSERYAVFEIWNSATDAKHAMYDSQNATSRAIGSVKWNNTTDQITSMSVFPSAAVNMLAGSRIIVSGSD